MFNKQPAGIGGGVPVSLKLIDEKDFAHQGRMDFVDNAIDRSSGTIRGRAVFSNADGMFLPGMFGRIRVPGSPPYTALLIPDAAVGSEQVRKYVLVVDDGGVVRQKYVKLGQTADQLRVIKDGLQADDLVIVNGLMRARPGQKVTPEVAPAPPPQDPSAVIARGRPQIEDPVAAGGHLGIVGGQDQGPAAGRHLEEPGQGDGP